MTVSTIFRGCGFEDTAIPLTETAIIYMIPVISIEENDELSVNGEVKVYDGDPIAIFHGETQIGTISNSGSFSRPFTAADNGNEVTVRPTGDSHHEIGFLEIEKTD